jgi:hypothetical protein
VSERGGKKMRKKGAVTCEDAYPAFVLSGARERCFDGAEFALLVSDARLEYRDRTALLRQRRN